jgi:membrane-associated protein
MSEADARGTGTPDGRPERPAPGGPGPGASGPDASGPDASGPGTATAAGTGTPAGTPKKRFRWRNSDYTPEELAEAKKAARKAWRDAVPWDHPMTRGDKFLVFSTLGIIAFMALTMPLRPFLLASHPIGLSFVTGSLSAIGAGAAFARIGEASLWLVVVAGIVGMIKFDWLFWLAGRRWGPKVVELFAPGEAAQRFVSTVRSWPRWALGLVVVLSTIPGIPAPAVFALAGLGRMRLVTFLLFDALGAALMTGLVAGLGFGLGQHAVDVVLMIDEYALYVTLGLVAVVTVGSVRRDRKARAEREAATASAPTTATGTAE